METLATRLKWLSRMQPPGSNEQRIMLEAAQELEYEEILETEPEEETHTSSFAAQVGPPISAIKENGTQTVTPAAATARRRRPEPPGEP